MAGCAAEEPRFVHETVRVPEKYQGARPCPGAVASDHERYVQSFEDAWWKCIGAFVEDIDYQPTIGDKCGNGWPSAWAGYADGFNDAERQVLENIRRFGKARTKEALRRVWECP